MGTTVKAPPITVEQYLSFQAPPGFRDELINGEIVLSPDPKPLHQEIAHRICTQLNELLQGSVFVARQRTNMVMRDDHSMPSPDVFVIDWERWYGSIESGYPERSPQLAIEVVSASNRKRHIREKVRLYLKNGASSVWVVFPKQRQVLVCELSGDATDSRAFDEGDEIPLPAPLPSHRFPVRACFDFDRAF